MKQLRWVGIIVAVLLLLSGALATWVLNSRAGTQWAVDTTVNLMDGKLAIDRVEGTLVTPLSVAGVRYRDPESGIDVSVASASLDLAFRELFSRRVHVLDAKVADVAAILSKPSKPPEESKPFNLKPPIEIVVDRFTLQGAKVVKDGKMLFEATQALAVAGWTNEGIGVRQLDVVSPQGRITVKGALSHSRTYNGQASGHFRWRQGEHQYAGSLELLSEKGEAQLNALLSSPLDARVKASARQGGAMPWQLSVQVPKFDPREELLPGSAIESVMLALDGRGDREHAHITAEVELNGAKVFLDPIKVAFRDQVLTIDELMLRDARRRGQLSVVGNVRFDREPFFADLGIRWRDVEMPEKVAGQKLLTQGELKARGNPREFEASGDLVVGPPGRPANISLAANGTPRAVTLENFSISQKQGHLVASGNIGLQPAKTWRIAAQAKNFDPGALFAGWPGSLGFELTTAGKIVAGGGPDAVLHLQSLRGHLRKRQIAGDADLKITPSKAVAGVLNLRSGASTVRVTGAGGRTLDVTANFNIASMDDWLPDAQGQLSGRVTAQGEWPKIAVVGNVQGQGLGINDMSLRRLTVQADIREPLHPRGSLKASLKDISAAGFDFASVELQADGSEAEHSARLTAIGSPLSTEVNVTGSRLANGWSGAVQSLTLTVPNMEALVLRQATQVKVAGKSFSISDSCLANSEISVCAAGEQTEAGELQARYAIERLPLSLLVAVAQPDSGYVVKGTIEGKGDIRRTAEGALFGNATLASGSGSVAEEGEESDPLLSYRNFQLAADLHGDAAHATASMAFNEGGSVDGEISIGDLRGAAPTLNGHVALNIGDLSPLGLFVTQLAAIEGNAAGEVAVRGTTTAPAISGTAALRDFSAELPLLGLELKDGNIQASMSGAGAIELQGQITSGKGQILLAGGGQSLDALTIKANGKDVLAANIPGANVVVAPDLSFSRRDERMDLTGTVTVASANIDLTKLPRGKDVKQASPDIVVVDDPKPEVEAVKAMQLYTDVTVILGEGMRTTAQLEKVQLVGFGLDAKLAGQLGVKEGPGSDPLGVGEIRVEGNYKAYGQDLTIQSGRLLYANTPLSDPQVDIVAVREVEDVTAKLTVKGSAQAPILEVSSDPSMPQTAALSYLVTGKPLDQLGTGEGDIVQSAARSLGGAAGNLLAKSLGKRLGVDEIGIDNSAEIGGSAFTVGQYLSPRLYISYGVGLFDPGQVVTLRYRLSRAVNVEASQGPRNQRAGVNYRREK